MRSRRDDRNPRDPPRLGCRKNVLRNAGRAAGFIVSVVKAEACPFEVCTLIPAESNLCERHRAEKKLRRSGESGGETP